MLRAMAYNSSKRVVLTWITAVVVTAQVVSA